MDASESKSVVWAPLRWVRAHTRLLGIVVALVLLYAMAGFVLLPIVARHSITNYVEHDLRRRVSIGALHFNPFTLTVQAQQFALTENDGAPLASFRLLRISASASSLWYGAWTFHEVRLEQPVANVLIDHDGSLNLAKLAPAAPAQVTPKPPTPPASWPRVRIGALIVREGRVHLEDRSRGAPFVATLSPIEFSLNDFRTAPKFASRYRFSAQTNANEKLDWSGTLSVQPLGSDGQFAITGLKAATIAAYLQDALPFALRSGSLDLLGDYQFTAAAGSRVALRLPRLSIHQLAIAPKAAAADAPWIALPELEVTDASVALPGQHIAIGQVSLHNAALQVWRETDGTLNLQRLWSTGAATSTAAAATRAGDTGASGGAAVAPAGSATASGAAPSPWTVTLARLSIDGAVFNLEDRSVTPAAQLRLGPLALTVRDYSSAGTEPLGFELNTALGVSGRLQSSGSVAVTPLQAAVTVDLKQFDLTVLQPYVGQQTGLTIYRGNLAVQAQLHYAGAPPKGQPQALLTGSAAVTDFATRDKVTNTDFITGRALQVLDVRYQQTPNALSIERVRARGVYGRVIVGANGSLNLSNVLRPQGASGAPASIATRAPHAAAAPTPLNAPAASAAMPMRIGRVDIENGTADFSDHSVQPNFSSAILGLNGSIVGLSSDPSSRAKVQLQGSVNRYAPVSITGEVNLLSAATYTDLGLSFHNIELTTFNPYSGKFAGYSITQGKLTTEMHYHVANRKLEATHHVEIDQLEFGAATASKQAVPLPVKLAAALLKDRHGLISLDLPVSGSIDDPQFRVGPLIWKVFVGLITKIVTAPFALLGSLFGGGQQLSYIDFPAGSATFPAAEAQKLEQLSKALIERPQLKLDIPLHTISVADDQALASAALEQAVTAVNTVDNSPTPPAVKGARKGRRVVATAGTAAPAATTPAVSPRLLALAALYRQRLQAEPEYPGDASTDALRSAWLEQQLLGGFAPKREERDAIARARAEAVQAALLMHAEVAPTRVFLTERESGGGPAGSVRMELKLQ